MIPLFTYYSHHYIISQGLLLITSSIDILLIVVLFSSIEISSHQIKFYCYWEQLYWMFYHSRIVFRLYHLGNFHQISYFANNHQNHQNRQIYLVITKIINWRLFTMFNSIYEVNLGDWIFVFIGIGSS